jgi:coenzyme F420-0:L-glutamate ligase/coenzyme F420-1:gamma-L-glutamate ligase
VVPIDDWRGRHDARGQVLAATSIAAADQLAAAADLVRTKTSGTPGVVIHGAERSWTEADGPGAAPLRRAAADDLFR